MTKAWCVGYYYDPAAGAMPCRSGWCVLMNQPANGNRPRYRRLAKTLCGVHVMAPGKFEHREPTCAECLKRLQGREG